MNVETFIGLLENVHRTTRGVMAQCPAHADHNPSLSTTEGEDGRILVHCFAGCSVQEICEALGLQVRDLFSGRPNYPRLRKGQRRRERERGDRRREAAHQGVRVELLRESGGLIRAAVNIDISRWTPETLNAELSRLAAAYRILEEEDNG